MEKAEIKASYIRIDQKTKTQYQTAVTSVERYMAL